MASILVVHECSGSPERAWSRLTRFEDHAAGIPLTRICPGDPPPDRPGGTFVARTRLGPLSFDDPMEIVRWQPPGPAGPGFCRIEKRGSAVTGFAEIDVEGLPRGMTRVVWREELRVQGIPSAIDPLLAIAGRRLFRRLVVRLLG